MNNFKSIRRMFVISFFVALVSQINLGLMNTEFVISAGIIIFVSFLVYYDDLNPVALGEIGRASCRERV